MAIARTRLTLEEFLKIPEIKPYLEYDGGVVVQKADADFVHGCLHARIPACIDELAGERQLAMAFPSLTTVFGGNALTPDVAVYRWDRVPRDPDGGIAAVYGDVPDMVIDISSPDQDLDDQIRRCHWYVNNGVAIVLLVDPDSRSLRDFRPGQSVRMLSGLNEINVDDLLPGCHLLAQDLFRGLRSWG